MTLVVARRHLANYKRGHYLCLPHSLYSTLFSLSVLYRQWYRWNTPLFQEMSTVFISTIYHPWLRIFSPFELVGTDYCHWRESCSRFVTFFTALRRQHDEGGERERERGPRPASTEGSNESKGETMVCSKHSEVHLSKHLY